MDRIILESLLWMISLNFFDDIPWSFVNGVKHFQYFQKLNAIKDGSEFLSKLPDHLAYCFGHVRGLKYWQKPNYELLFNLLDNMFKVSFLNFNNWLQFFKLMEHSRTYFLFSLASYSTKEEIKQRTYITQQQKQQLGL